MRNFESSVDHYQRQRHQKTAETLERALKRNAINPEEFRTPQNSRDVDRDINYATETKKRFGEREKENYHPKALECFLTVGIMQGRILGTTPGSTKRTEATVTSDYDDYSNRIDLAVTMYPKEAKDGITFGIDATTNPNKNVILEKLLIASNSPSFDRPIGVGQLKYFKYKDGRKTSKIGIPRYCIGIGTEPVDDMLDAVQIADGRLSTEASNVAKYRNQITRFKIMQEVLAQNQLFLSQYDKMGANSLSKEDARVYKEMSTLNNIFTKELSRLSEILPPYAYEYGKGVENVKRYCMRSDPTFANVMETTEELVSVVNTKGLGALEQIRAAVEDAHNPRNSRRMGKFGRQVARQLHA